MKVSFIFIALLTTCYMSHAAKEAGYRIQDIPEKLKKNADAVIRLNETTVAIIAPDKVQYHVHNVLSILNNKADDMGAVYLSYNQVVSIRSFKARVIDAQGNVFKQYNKASGLDFSGDMPQNVTDDRVKVWSLNKLKPPYTIDYEYDLDFSSAFFVPGWHPVLNRKVSMEKGIYTVTFEPGMKVNYVDSNVDKPVVTPGSMTWQASVFEAVAEEDYTGNNNRHSPWVTVTTDDYELFGIKGSARTWSDLSHFVYELNKQRNSLPAIEDPKLKELCASSLPVGEKVKSIYRYLQDNTRYVLISKGLGGWQPAPASFTFEKKYGDCKALAVLMQAMLSQAGIPSYCLLINGGRGAESMDLRLPCSQFNHEIIMVPDGKDTFWLDCTDVYGPFNYLGSFTANRPCLIIDDAGGHIVHTPAYNETKNRLMTRIEVDMNNNDVISVKGVVSSEAELQEVVRLAFTGKDPKKIDAAIANQLRLKNTNIKSSSVEDINMAQPLVRYRVELDGRNWITKTSGRLFLKTDLLPPYGPLPAKEDKRTSPVRIPQGVTHCDTLIFHLPRGYIPENFVNNDVQTVSSYFGEMSRHISYDSQSNTLIFIRNFVLKMHTYSTEKFEDLRNFMIKAYAAYMPELVMKKGT